MTNLWVVWIHKSQSSIQWKPNPNSYSKRKANGNVHSPLKRKPEKKHVASFFSFFSPRLLFHSLRHFRVVGLVRFDLQLLCLIQRSYFFSLPFPHTSRKFISLPGSLCTSCVSFHILYPTFTLLLCRYHEHTASFRQILQVMDLLPAVSLRPGAQKTSEGSARACNKLSGKFYIVSEKE